MRPLILSAALALFLAACAGPRTHELVGSCWQDDPSSKWVVENELHARADFACQGRWDLVAHSEEVDQNIHTYRWTVACKPE